MTDKTIFLSDNLKNSTIGIVAEYNPFHSGHAYMIDQARKMTGAEYVAVIMSGDFVQRGEPAVFDKYFRTALALSGGADVVMELPAIYATASAELFAEGAVATFAASKTVHTICFGTEHTDFPYTDIARLLLEEPGPYRQTLRKMISSGHSYPGARAQAIIAGLSAHPLRNNIPEQLLLKYLREPNTILGIEYAKAALRYHMEILPVLRVGNSYHDPSLNGTHLSASAIRGCVLSEPGAQSDIPGVSTEHSNRMASYLLKKRPLSADSLDDILFVSLLNAQNIGYTAFLDCDEPLSRRIQNMLNQYTGFTSFANLLKSKNYTHSRIRRTLLHIALNIRKNDIPGDRYEHSYIRLLGLRKSASCIIRNMQDFGDAPVITRVADAEVRLNPDTYKIFQKDLFAASVYEQLAKSAQKINEYKRGPVLL